MGNLRVTFLGTGSGGTIYRPHIAIALDCADGTRVLLDAASGNSVLVQGAAVGMLAQDFGPVLLSHHHPDHVDGLFFLQLQRRMLNPGSPPLDIYGSEETLDRLRRLCLVTWGPDFVDQDGTRTVDGSYVYRWHPSQEGQVVELGATTRAFPFLVDHTARGAVGWRVESDGVAVVFSGDTRFSPNLVEAAQGARLLIHEAFGTEKDRERAHRVGHSVAVDVGRAAALAGVEELMITHINSTYHFDPQPLVDEARQHYDGPISVPNDLDQITVGTA